MRDPARKALSGFLPVTRPAPAGLAQRNSKGSSRPRALLALGGAAAAGIACLPAGAVRGGAGRTMLTGFPIGGIVLAIFPAFFFLAAPPPGRRA